MKEIAQYEFKQIGDNKRLKLSMSSLCFDHMYVHSYFLLNLCQFVSFTNI